MGAILGLVASSWQSWMQDKRNHRAAVHAVVLEMTTNIKVLDLTLRGSMVTAHAKVDTTAYDALLLPLYSKLPADLASSVADAYSWLHAFKDFAIGAATEARPTVVSSRDQLRSYATRRLKLTFSEKAKV